MLIFFADLFNEWLEVMSYFAMKKKIEIGFYLEY